MEVTTILNIVYSIPIKLEIFSNFSRKRHLNKKDSALNVLKIDFDVFIRI